MNNSKPFLRWAGGKNWLVRQITPYLPAVFNDYHEPFLGSASLFIYLKNNGFVNHRSFLSDLNVDLIQAYNVVKEDPISVEIASMTLPLATAGAFLSLLSTFQL